MELTDEQQMYTLPDCYLLLMLGDNDVCGIVSNNIYDIVDAEALADCGFYFKKINFDTLLSQAYQILRDEGLI